MALMDKLRAYLHSSQGKQAVEKAKRMAEDPSNQRKARQFFDKLRSRRPHH
ncbi:hypothetical protein ACWGH8_01430 [Nonomuraea muscovyensis]|jgi:hypothetical protein|uniref:Uncharacterized protein n=1 Tax=Nonomuraea muscovyensis TaxID=1124761 RepID=A0A7X0BYI2_9ACTN|nr:hypothetical protein [Nonomuraea muscovyensis]MBB6345097.1 hypothetical protein [Nonomuraea muscovyensis]MDF2706080.1 hypothetical protein [Nonomuraea muscovyensis]